MTQSQNMFPPFIEKTFSENLPEPLFTKEGKFLPFLKGGKEGLWMSRIPPLPSTFDF